MGEPKAALAVCSLSKICPVRWAYKPYFFSQRIIFFSHNKSTNSTFSHDLSASKYDNRQRIIPSDPNKAPAPSTESAFKEQVIQSLFNISIAQHTGVALQVEVFFKFLVLRRSKTKSQKKNLCRPLFSFFILSNKSSSH